MSPQAAVLSGQVLIGINTIYTVMVEGRRLQCRIKGKVLKRDQRTYNPIAPGDFVDVVADLLDPAEGKIIAVHPRRTSLARWNKKGRAPQIIAANADFAVCVTSPKSPPFRPRFIDRLIVAAEAGGMTPLILLNKCDLEIGPGVRERLSHYERMGYGILCCSAISGQGLSAIEESLGGHCAVFVGQSGVGKTSILNALSPGMGLKVGPISSKHDRGSHTTNYSALFAMKGDLRLIDTPGVRELELSAVLPEEVSFYFRDFAAFADGCSYQPCSHDGEPGCAVAAAAVTGGVHPDRYESYRRILRELRAKTGPGKNARGTAHGRTNARGTAHGRTNARGTAHGRENARGAAHGRANARGTAHG
jgi:ribosome biogenesis GTPase